MHGGLHVKNRPFSELSGSRSFLRRLRSGAATGAENCESQGAEPGAGAKKPGS